MHSVDFDGEYTRIDRVTSLDDDRLLFTLAKPEHADLPTSSGLLVLVDNEGDEQWVLQIDDLFDDVAAVACGLRDNDGLFCAGQQGSDTTVIGMSAADGTNAAHHVGTTFPGHDLVLPPSGELLTDGDLFLQPSKTGTLLRYDPAADAVEWTLDLPGPATGGGGPVGLSLGAGPLADGATAVTWSTDGRTGTDLVDLTTGAVLDSVPVLVVAGDELGTTVSVLDERGAVSGVQGWNPDREKVWSHSGFRPIAEAAGGLLPAVGGDGNLVGIRTDTGELRWDSPVPWPDGVVRRTEHFLSVTPVEGPSVILDLGTGADTGLRGVVVAEYGDVLLVDLGHSLKAYAAGGGESLWTHGFAQYNSSLGKMSGVVRMLGDRPAYVTESTVVLFSPVGL